MNWTAEAPDVREAVWKILRIIASVRHAGLQTVLQDNGKRTFHCRGYGQSLSVRKCAGNLRPLDLCVKTFPRDNVVCEGRFDRNKSAFQHSPCLDRLDGRHSHCGRKSMLHTATSVSSIVQVDEKMHGDDITPHCMETIIAVKIDQTLCILILNNDLRDGSLKTSRHANIYSSQS